MDMPTCYMCDAPAVSREHVPPKCIFPEDAQFRINLIKVPSCDVHNLQKSNEDELLRHVLVCAPGTNNLARHILERSVMPAFNRRPHIIDTFLPNLTPLQIGNIETAATTIDLSRFDSSIQAIARGLFFADTGKKLLAELAVAWGALLSDDLTEAPFLEIVRYWEQALPPMQRGTNPKVFQYDFHEFNNQTSALCRLRFYEGHPIYVVWYIA
jgi:hypothetical protein